MNRLSALDSLFLYLETPETPMHVASVTIFNPVSPQDGLFERFRAHTAARLDLLPSYRRRLKPTPLGLDHPAWVLEEKLDLDYHIRHAALPKPGGMAELRALVAELHAIPLDRSRPLWEWHFIEGLQGGAFAVYAKVHHCAMDALAGMATLGVMYDFAADADTETPPLRIVPPDPELSDAIELTSSAFGDFVRQGWRAITGAPGLARSLAKAAPHFSRDASFLYKYVAEMPRTPFNVVISPHRVYATASLPLAEVKALAKARGVTINDVVLAVTAGALRRYLSERGALPEKALTAGVPASLRPLGNAQLNNQVTFTLSRLPTDVAEPLPRLGAAQAAGRDAKALFGDIREFFTTDVSILGAPLVITAVAKLLSGTRASNWLSPFFNVVLSNAPGPREPMYCVGAPATHYFPVSIPYHGCALNITVHSYLDQLDFGLVACSKTVPDAQRIADFIAEDFAAMRTASAAVAREDAVERIEVDAKPAAVERPTVRIADAKPESSEVSDESSPLMRQIDALSAATEALKRKLERRTASRPLAKARLAPKAAPSSKGNEAKPKRKRPAPPASPIVDQPAEHAPANSGAGE